MKKSDLRVVIIGGGIGGAATAVAMHHAGIPAHVYEQATAIREVGAGIGLRPPTIHYFKKWGLLEEIERVTHKSVLMEILNEQAEIFIEEQWPALTDDPEEKWARLIHRADCLDTLVNAIPEGYLHLNHRLKDIVKHDGYAEVIFENGTIIEADLVIGADGIRSLTRNLFFSQELPVFHHYHAYRALVDEEATFGLHAEDKLRIFVNNDVNMYLLPLKYRKQVSVDVTIPAEDSAWSPNGTKEKMLEALKNFHPNLQKIVENLDGFDCKALYDINPVDRWTNDCIAIIGDAAHSMLHNQGQGANMAIQDGGCIAECLLEADTIEGALKMYETIRKPIAQKYQELSRLFFNEEIDTAFPEKPFFEKVSE